MSTPAPLGAQSTSDTFVPSSQLSSSAPAGHEVGDPSPTAQSSAVGGASSSSAPLSVTVEASSSSASLNATVKAPSSSAPLSATVEAPSSGAPLSVPGRTLSINDLFMYFEELEHAGTSTAHTKKAYFLGRHLTHLTQLYESSRRGAPVRHEGEAYSTPIFRGTAPARVWNRVATDHFIKWLDENRDLRVISRNYAEAPVTPGELRTLLLLLQNLLQVIATHPLLTGLTLARNEELFLAGKHLFGTPTSLLPNHIADLCVDSALDATKEAALKLLLELSGTRPDGVGWFRPYSQEAGDEGPPPASFGAGAADAFADLQLLTRDSELASEARCEW